MTRPISNTPPPPARPTLVGVLPFINPAFLATRKNRGKKIAAAGFGAEGAGDRAGVAA